MDQLDADIEALEANIYQPKSGVTAATDEVDFGPVLLLKKRLLLVRQALAPLRDMLNQLLRPDMSTLIASSSLVYFQDVYDHTLRLIEEVDLHREILNGVTDALRAEAGNRLNQVVRTMTGISTILMSAALIAGIYGMNFKFMPELEWRYGYFYALASMVAVAAGLTVFFKRIRWF
jgi:magnesium transporter